MDRLVKAGSLDKSHFAERRDDYGILTQRYPQTHPLLLEESDIYPF